MGTSVSPCPQWREAEADERARGVDEANLLLVQPPARAGWIMVAKSSIAL